MVNDMLLGIGTFKNFHGTIEYQYFLNDTIS